MYKYIAALPKLNFKFSVKGFDDAKRKADYFGRKHNIFVEELFVYEQKHIGFSNKYKIVKVNGKWI